MAPDTLLMTLTALGVVVLFGALAVYLVRISRTLEAIGGEADSYLAKIAFGVRAIEQETSHIEPQVGRLNEGLTAAAGGLQAIRDDLDAVLEAVGQQRA